MTRSARILLFALCASAAFVLALTAVRYLDRPLRGDEADWPAQVQAIARHGVPRVGFDEERVQHVIGYFGYDAHYGMWHPPLYHYALAVAYAAAGDRDWAYRSVGLICLAVTLFILWKLAADHLDRGAPRGLRLLPVALPLLAPLVVEGSLFVDIDGTVLLAATTLLLWRFLRPGDAYAPRRLAELSVLFFAALLAKLTTPVVLMGSLAVYAALGPRPVRGVAAVALATVAGASMFALAYWSYCFALDYPPSFMWDVTYMGKRDLYASIKSLNDVLFAARWNLVWVSPAMALLIASVFARRILRLVRVRSAEPVDLLVIFSTATFLGYVAVGAMWGKYTAPAAAIGAAAAGLELARSWPRLVVRRTYAFGAGLVCLAGIVAMAPVPFARPPLMRPATGLLALALDPRNISFVAIAGAAAIFAGAAARRWMTGGGRWAAAEAALAAALVVVAPITAARVVLPGGDRGPLRPFADRGFRAAADHLNATTGFEMAIVAPKDFGRYFGGRVYPLDDLLQAGGAPLVARVARRPDVGALVDSSRYPLLSDESVGRAIGVGRIDRIQDFRILVKKTPSASNGREPR